MNLSKQIDRPIDGTITKPAAAVAPLGVGAAIVARRLERVPRIAFAGSAALLALFFSLDGRANAAFDATITATVSAASGNEFLYSYLVSVLNDSSSSVSVLDINLGDTLAGGTLSPAIVDSSSITQPTGFSFFYTPGETYIEWDSSSSPTDIHPGSSGTFSFLSATGPGPQDYQVYSYDTNEFSDGTVMAPSPRAFASADAPEPSPALLFPLGLGFAGAVRIAVRRRGRSTTV